MKINDVRPHRYIIDTKNPITSIQPSINQVSPSSRRVEVLIVEIETSTGEIGYGEAMTSAGAELVNSSTAPICYKIINSLIKPGIIGAEIGDIDFLWTKMNKLAGYHGMGGLLLDAISGVDTAIWDILGKERKQPISKIINRDSKNKIKVYASKIPGVGATHNLYSFEKNIRNTKMQGFKGIKIGGGLGIENDVLSVRKAKEILGKEVDVMIDIFGAYSREVALNLVARINNLDLEWVECPIDPFDFDGYVELSKNMSGKIGLDPVPEINCLKKMINTSQKFVPLIDVTRDGGVTAFKNVAEYCNIAGANLSVHSGWAVTAVGIAASLQMAASFNNIHWMEFRSQFGDNPFIVDITKHSFMPKRGFVDVPQKPGIGIDLNLEKMSEFEVK